MPINQRRYVDITSAVIGAGGVAQQRLDGRIFTNNQAIGSTEILEFYDAPEVAAFFGQGSDEAAFAAKYFALTTPAPVSKAQALQFAYHAAEQRSYQFAGSAPAEYSVLEQIADGELTATVNDVDFEVTGIDFTDVGVESMFDIASLLTTKFAGANITFDYNGSAFVVYGSVGIDLGFDGSLASQLGLDSPASIDGGQDSETMAQAWMRAQQASNNYGSCYFLGRGELSECVAVAELVAAENVRHQIYIAVEHEERQAYADALGGTASCGLILSTDAEPFVAHIPMALMSATNYSRRNSTMNYMYRQAGVTVQPQVTDTEAATELDTLGINYYGVTAEAGSLISFFQDGYLGGPASAPKDMSVHANEQWLKSRLIALWLNMQTGTRGIPANLDGKRNGTSVIAEVVAEAIRNGVILRGKSFNPVQKQAIADATGDDNGWVTVANDGAWYDVRIVDYVEHGKTKYKLDYVLVYGAGDWVRKVTGSHNLA